MYEDKTYENIKTSILDKIEGIDKREGSFLNDMVSPLSFELEGAYQQFNAMLGIMFLDDSTGIYLEKRAKEYGITRKQGTYATGEVTFTGNENTVIPQGSLVSTTTNLIFETIEDVIIEASTEATVGIEAQNVGAKYNVLANTVTLIPVSINGVTAVTNNIETLGGTDIETDKELLNRTLLQIQNPATSGNAMHYKLWALEEDGVGDAKIFPLANGNGTVLVLPITSDKEAPDNTILQNIRDNIEANRPIGATVTVNAPTEVIINVNATINLDSNYTVDSVLSVYTEKFSNYIKDSVFKIYNVDYFKCLSIMYEVPGVLEVTDFQLNNGTVNIIIGEQEIQVTGTINIT